ncbi:Flp family type IVb pilin [Caloramator sp. mosi_1]|uniref:Flp family type IVb pilin n=1 Tax=Caloramator sp. mosi_1 TaxID=3023090 RepID=UPI002362BADF|nr:Flp family type IVb pilin [Caloramator sp. mosi_1]WDC85548.1 Flp family type IVb pilin [Caloramator sp. mosi_1]
MKNDKKSNVIDDFKEKGQGMVEYALLVALIAIVVIGSLVLLGPAIAAKFNEIMNNL